MSKLFRLLGLSGCLLLLDGDPDPEGPAMGEVVALFEAVDDPAGLNV